MKGLLVKVLLLCFLLFNESFLNAQVLHFDSLAVKAGFEKSLILAKIDYEKTVADEFSSIGSLLAKFSFPAEGKIISQFGVRSGRMHTGTDIKMRLGDTIYAVYDGLVTCSRYRSGYGNLIVIRHENNLDSYYGLLSRFLIKAGSKIARGEPIGLAGATGRATTTHLHFEIRENDKPYDPELVFDFENQMLNVELKNIEYLADLNVKNSDQIEKETQNSKKYIVQSGDSLWVISHRVKTTVESLCMLNNLTENSVLYPGQVLTVY